VLAAAERLSAAHPLRALDAIHMASAQLFALASFISVDLRERGHPADHCGSRVGDDTRHIES